MQHIGKKAIPWLISWLAAKETPPEVAKFDPMAAALILAMQGNDAETAPPDSDLAHPDRALLRRILNRISPGPEDMVSPLPGLLCREFFDGRKPGFVPKAGVLARMRKCA